MHFLKISASLLVYSLSYSILKDASTSGQIVVFTISVFESHIVTFFQYIIDNSPFESTSNHNLFGKKCFWCKICAQ